MKDLIETREKCHKPSKLPPLRLPHPRMLRQPAAQPPIWTLPTPQVRKVQTPVPCPLCGKMCSRDHIAAGCRVALDQGRYLWRHNKVLDAMYQGIVQHLEKPMSRGLSKENWEIRVDTDNRTTTLSSHVFGNSSSRPDMVIMFPKQKSVLIIELTCPLPHNMQKWHDIKMCKYAPPVAYANNQGWAAKLYAIEISTMGDISTGFSSMLMDSIGLPMQEADALMRECGTTSKQCTEKLFHAWEMLSWTQQVAGQGPSL